jgi:2'-5' RNA ligase
MRQKVDGNGKSSMRLFYALWPDDAVRERLSALQAHVRGKKTRYDNLHITLAFLGEQAPEVLPVLRGVLDGLPRDAFELTLDRFGYFARKRIAWAGPRKAPQQLNHLAQALTQSLHSHGIAFDTHADFKPHVTLARDADPPPDFSFEPIAWHANRIALVHSVMQQDGVHYRIIAEAARRSSSEIPSGQPQAR